MARRVGPKGSVSAVEVVRRVDVSGVDEAQWPELVAAETEAATGRLRPEAGVMTQVVWFDAGPQRPGRLLWLAHHLVVDGVSWRILVPDLVSAWRQLGEGVSVGQVQLPPVGTSYRRWAQQLAAEARRPEREEEVDLWLDLLDRAAGRMDPTVDPRRRRAYPGVVLPADLTSDC